MLLRRFTFAALAVTILSGAVSFALLAEPVKTAAAKPDVATAERKFKEGNYKEAYDGFRALALDPQSAGDRPGHYLTMAVSSLQSLGRVDEIDEFREAVIKTHAKNWRLLWTAAQSYLNVDHSGFMVAGKFNRGPHRGGGKAVHAMERDRVRSLQLLQESMPLAIQDSKKSEVASFFMDFARLILANRGHYEAWRLQYLTDLGTLPDYEEGWYHGGEVGGAPVDEDGNPVFHKAPKSWDASETDGERWRWCLAMAAEVDPAQLNTVRWTFADFLHNQFGVQTMAYYGWYFGRMEDDDKTDDDKKNESGTYALHTLDETETIARLANGIKRFKLPDEFNYVRIYQQIADEPKTGYGDQSLQQLAQIFENRRQYPKAAEYWRRSIREFGKEQGKQQRLDQIVSNWGRFEPVMTQPAGKGATVDFRFRNGKQVSFEAHAIKVDKLLTDVKAYLKSNPRQLDWQKRQHRRHRLSAGASEPKAIRRRARGKLVARSGAAREPL